ncbi:hypothetical protein EI94DRAFT_1706634 [Lactarius quietus]|nr:hypothetical protein EI94DRAFT_1706634 [Lactarius quietus]
MPPIASTHSAHLQYTTWPILLRALHRALWEWDVRASLFVLTALSAAGQLGLGDDRQLRRECQQGGLKQRWGNRCQAERFEVVACVQSRQRDPFGNEGSTQAAWCLRRAGFLISVQDHTKTRIPKISNAWGKRRPRDIMLVALSLDGLSRDDISRGEKDGQSRALCRKWPLKEKATMKGEQEQETELKERNKAAIELFTYANRRYLLVFQRRRGKPLSTKPATLVTRSQRSQGEAPLHPFMRRRDPRQVGSSYIVQWARGLELVDYGLQRDDITRQISERDITSKMHAKLEWKHKRLFGGGYGTPVSNEDAAFSRSVALVSAHFRAGCVVSTRVVLDAAVEVAPKGKGKSYLGPETANSRIVLPWVTHLQREYQGGRREVMDREDAREEERRELERLEGEERERSGKQNPQLGNTLIAGAPDSEGRMAGVRSDSHWYQCELLKTTNPTNWTERESIESQCFGRRVNLGCLHEPWFEYLQ